ncbi:unnamed protein product [Sphagnum troendelagicum]|uniref:Cytochrome P450 n=1 Tax=Sphagnum troendelagicum TaxID=128251 RepID=A0ABP0V448_9BRYO
MPLKLVGSTAEWSFPVVFLTSLVVLLLSLLFVLRIRRKLLMKLPPGPPTWPIVGSMFTIIRTRGRPSSRVFTTLAKRYGPLLFFWIGLRPTIVVSSAEMAMALLRTCDRTFASRPKFAPGKYLGYGYSNVVFAPSGPHFRLLRKLYASELLSPAKIERMLPLRMEEVGATIRCILESVASADEQAKACVIDVRSLMLSANLNIIGRMLFSKRLFDLDTKPDTDVHHTADGLGVPAVSPRRKAAEEFKSFVKEATKLIGGSFNAGDYIPALRWLDLQGVERTLRQFQPKIERLLLPLIQEHRRRHAFAIKEKENSDQLDFIGSLLVGHSELSDNNLIAISIDLLVGGSDSTAASVEWTLAELLRHPDLLQKVQEELDIVVGRQKMVTESDISKLLFFNCVIKESLRLHPPVPTGAPHFSTSACTLGDYTIPPHTTAYVNIHAINRDPTIWADPEAFRPHRFFDSCFNVYGQDFGLLPFSSGRRGCPGVHAALANLKLMLASLLHSFSWTLPPSIPNPKDLDMRERVGIVSPKLTPLQAIVRPRLPTDLILETLKT